MSFVKIFDTTLRDGEQAGHPMNGPTKIRIAHALSDAGVAVIEAGFPCSSDGNAEIVRRIAAEVRHPIICALARVKQIDVEAAIRAVENAARPRVHVFASTSNIHIERKLRSTKGEVLQAAADMVAFARRRIDDVEFSAEDATRTDPEYLALVVRTAIQAGAGTINLPDTVGYSHPTAIEEMIRTLYIQVPELANVTLSMHCHNDLGMAVANSLAGVMAGARQVEGCFLGIGERAGNVALEAVVMTLESHKQSLGFETGITTEKIGPLCRLISEETGYPIPDHHPVVGSSALTHSSGIHVDGVNKDRETYEIMRAEDVGWQGSSSKLTNQMGRNGLCEILVKLGYDGETLIDKVYPEYLKLADLMLELTEDDLRILAEEALISEMIDQNRLFKIIGFDYHRGWGSVRVRRNGAVKEAQASGDGAVHALFSAIRSAVTDHGYDLGTMELTGYDVRKGSGGPEAIGSVVVRVSMNGQIGLGRCSKPDINEASARAFIYAINTLFRAM